MHTHPHLFVKRILLFTRKQIHYMFLAPQDIYKNLLNVHILKLAINTVISFTFFIHIHIKV